MPVQRTPLRQSSRTRMYYDDIKQVYSDPLLDRRAHKIGDTITVLVDIGTTVNNLDQRQMDKTSNSSATADTGISACARWGPTMRWWT